MLSVICIADMLSTLYWIHGHRAVEANPWMAHWLRHGDLAFCLTKIISFVPFLLFAAYYRPRRPRLIAIALRGTIALYLAIYVASVGVQCLPL